ncbi:MAG: DUF805 domain-containing protein [Mangrovibacterium sp.]
MKESFSTYFLDVLKNNYANFNGRARRSEYWMFALWNAVIITALSIIMGIIAAITNTMSLILVAYLPVFAFLIPQLALMSRRLHDVGKSGWFYFVSIIPLVGTIWLLVLLVSDSMFGDNQYGADPKADERIQFQASKPEV